MNSKYKGLIDLPHHVSATRKPMSLYDRAAQFAPFAALTGHDEAIDETARHTDDFVDISPDEQIAISSTINHALSHREILFISYFVPDKHKDGGAYMSTSGIIKKIDEYEHRLILDNGASIPINNIISANLVNNGQAT